MNDTKLAELVTKASTLDREQRRLENELKGLKKEIVAEAKTRKDAHEKTEGGGRSWCFTGSDGGTVRVTFPGKAIKGEIPATHEDFGDIKDAAGDAFDALFSPTLVYHTKENFRDLAADLLGDQARKLVRLVESKPSTKVSFETKEESEEG